MHCLIIVFDNSDYYRTFGECMYIGCALIIAYFTYVHKRKSFCVCMIFLLQFLHVFGEGYSWCWSYSVLIKLTTLFLFWAHFTQSNQSLVFPSLIFEYLEYVEAWTLRNAHIVSIHPFSYLTNLFSTWFLLFNLVFNNLLTIVTSSIYYFDFCF